MSGEGVRAQTAVRLKKEVWKARGGEEGGGEREKNEGDWLVFWGIHIKNAVLINYGMTTVKKKRGGKASSRLKKAESRPVMSIKRKSFGGGKNQSLPKGDQGVQKKLKTPLKKKKQLERLFELKGAGGEGGGPQKEKTRDGRSSKKRRKRKGEGKKIVQIQNTTVKRLTEEGWGYREREESKGKVVRERGKRPEGSGDGYGRKHRSLGSGST